MRLCHGLKILAIFSFLLAGCGNDALNRAEKLVSAYDYKAALEVLEQIKGDAREDDRFRRLKALSLFVEGGTEQGFDVLGTENLVKRQADALVLLNAAKVIIREKNRCAEAIRLLDSCLVFNPDMRDEIIEITWSRALEYLSVRGDAGYYLIEYLNGIDEETRGKLRSHNRIFYRRYEEIRNTYHILDLIKLRVNLFKGEFYRYPTNFEELRDKRFMIGITIPKGWHLEISSEGSERFLLTAEALKDNIGGVPPGTVLKLTDN